MMKKQIILTSLLISGFLPGYNSLAPAKQLAKQVETNAVSGCEFLLIIRDGGQKQTWQYRYDKNRLRINSVGRHIPALPINLLDFASNTISIIHPHNGTWEKSALNGSSTDKAFPAPPPPVVPPQMRMTQPVTPQPVPPQQMAPALPVIPPPPALPQQTNNLPNSIKHKFAPPAMPDLPANLPKGIGPGAANPLSAPSTEPASGGMPVFPAMPAMPPIGLMHEAPDVMKLIPQNKTNTLFGVTCRLYKMKITRNKGTLFIWLSNSPVLPPFYLPSRELPNQRYHAEWQEQVAQILRKKNFFPLHLELKTESGTTIAEWKIKSLKTDIKQKYNEEIFKVPEEMHLLPPPMW